MQFTKRKVTKSSSGPGVFLKFKDGESKVGVFKGEVYEFFSKWENDKSHVVEATETGAQSRFRLNFIIHEDGKFNPKIFEFGVGVYNQLADLSEEYDLEQIKVKITRRGVGKDTMWMILPILKEPLAPKTLKEIGAIPLNILEHKPQNDTPMPWSGNDWAPVEDEAPGF